MDREKRIRFPLWAELTLGSGRRDVLVVKYKRGAGLRPGDMVYLERFEALVMSVAHIGRGWYRIWFIASGYSNQESIDLYGRKLVRMGIRDSV